MFSFLLDEPRAAPLFGVQSTLLHVAFVTSALWATRSIPDHEVFLTPPEIALTWHEEILPIPGPMGQGAHPAPPIRAEVPPILPPIDPVLIGTAPVDPRTLVPGTPITTGTDSIGS